MNDPRGLAPQGWHVPLDQEWMNLINYLGGENIAGGKMKSTGTQYWQSPNTDATNEIGFSGLPGGYRYNGVTFNYIGYSGGLWSSTENYANGAWSRYLYYNYGYVYRGDDSKYRGLSVRCIKD